VNLVPVKSGMLGATMIGRPDKVSDTKIRADFAIATEWFTDHQSGYTRLIQKIGYYQVIEPDDARIFVTTDNLYHPSNLSKQNVIYLHQWQ